MALPAQHSAPSAHRLSDVLERLNTHIVEASIDLAPDLTMGVVGHANPAGFGNALKAGSNVYAVPKVVAALDHDVADVNPHPKVYMSVG
jgi:hypothetical protein